MSRQLKDDTGHVIHQVFEMNGVHVISNPSTSTQTPAFGAQTTAIRVATTGNHVHIAINHDPTASDQSSLLPANWVEIFAVKPGWKLAAIKGGGAGSPIISVTELV
jgi:hypothetical protein